MLEPIDIDTVWEQIEPAARALLPDPAVIRDDCRNGHAICFRCEDGYVVMRMKIDPRTSKRYLHLLFGNAITDQAGAFERALPEIQKCAKALRCSSIRFDTTIMGWLRLAPKLGFRCRNIEFELPMEAV